MSLSYQGLAREALADSCVEREDTDDAGAPSRARRLKVGVLVDLEDGPGAGGHVKFWRNVARAASALDWPVDLTVHVQGSQHTVRSLSEQVRIVALPPVLSSRRLGLGRFVPDHSDLAPLHIGLARALAQYDLVHTTDAYFAYAKTAERLAGRLGASLVTSVHTDTPAYARLYTMRMIEHLLGDGRLGRQVLERWAVPERLEAGMRRRFARHLRRCHHVWISPKQCPAGAEPPLLHPSASILRRGIDKETFAPQRRDRRRLNERFGIPPEVPVVAFAGRVDRAKGVLTLAEAARRLIESGQDIHVLLAGAGLDEETVRRQLGARVHLPGVVTQDELGWLLASADLFVFPSQVEVAPNAVLEAQAAGLPALVAPEGGGLYVERDGEDGIVVPDPDPAAWTAEMAALLEMPARARAIGAAARRRVERRHPSWRDVLEQDLLPHWLRARRPAEPRDAAHVWRTHPRSRTAS